MQKIFLKGNENFEKYALCIVKKSVPRKKGKNNHKFIVVKHSFIQSQEKEILTNLCVS